MYLSCFIFAPICPLGFCRGRESLQNLCEQIPGDALLYSMFKENAEPVRCPLKGTLTSHLRCIEFLARASEWFIPLPPLRTIYIYLQSRSRRVWRSGFKHWELHGGQPSAAEFPGVSGCDGHGEHRGGADLSGDVEGRQLAVPRRPRVPPSRDVQRGALPVLCIREDCRRIEGGRVQVGPVRGCDLQWTGQCRGMCCCGWRKRGVKS